MVDRDTIRAIEDHELERSEQAQVADESFRSTKVTDDYETWRQNPSRWDFEGVDTIPPERKQQRAEQALETSKELGLVDEFVESESEESLPGENRGTGPNSRRGVFEAHTGKLGVRSDLDDKQREETLAHEVGHAVDHGEWPNKASDVEGAISGDPDPMVASERMLDEVGGPIDDPDKPAKEMKTVSQNRRDWDESNRGYYEEPAELFADFIGDAILKPRNTKARTNESRKALAKEINDPIGELEPTKQFVEEELPNSFLPDIE